MISIKQVQDMILSKNPNSYYKVYREDECGYWSNIPQWILEKNIINCLDVGIAYGTLAIFTKLNHKCNLYGIDNKIGYLEKDIVTEHNVNLKIANIEKDELEYDIKFDAIIFTEVFEHLNFNPIPTLLKIKNLLSENGVIFFSTPDAKSWGKLSRYKKWVDIPNINNDIDYIDGHIYQYNTLEIDEIFKIVELQVDKISYSKNKYGLRHMNIQLSKIPSF